MGQYYKGEKIGTCETMYYIRLGEARELAKVGERDDDDIPFQSYLTDGVTRFRFPFPEEDSFTRLDFLQGSHSKSFEIPVGSVEVNHQELCLHSENRGGGYGMNISVPCPHSEEFRKKELGKSLGRHPQFLSVLYQGMRRETETDELKEKTIFACARCGQEQWFTSDDIAKIKEEATKYFKVYDKEENLHTYNRAMKIISRIQ